jgi:hypothetical protein
LLDFGDNILFDENRPLLEARLAHLISKEKVRQYYNYFTLIVFSAMEAREAGGGEMGLLSANATLKAIDCTAKFGNLKFN